MYSENMMQLKKTVWIIGISSMLSVTNTLAGTNDPTATVSLKTAWTDDSDTGDQNAAYSVQSSGIDWETDLVNGAANVSLFDWRNPGLFAEETGGKNPWGSLYGLQFGLHHEGVLTERVIYNVMAGVTSGFEKEADDSFAGYLGGYGMLQLRSETALLLGIYYSRHQEITTDFDLVPIIGLAWNQQTTGGLSFMVGLPETRATWHFSKRQRLVFDIRSIEGGIYRLADANPTRPGGYLELVSASANLSFEVRDVYGCDVAVGAGHTFHREIILYDKDGSNEYKYDVEQAPVLSFSLTRQF